MVKQNEMKMKLGLMKPETTPKFTCVEREMEKGKSFKQLLSTMLFLSKVVKELLTWVSLLGYALNL